MYIRPEEAVGRRELETPEGMATGKGYLVSSTVIQSEQAKVDYSSRQAPPGLPCFLLVTY